MSKFSVRGAARVILLTAIAALSACTTREYVAPDIDLASAPETVPEQRLLDVGIVEFSAGLPEDEADVPDEVYPDIRRAEAKYFPYHLRTTLQSTGHWGSVRVIPNERVVTDLYVGGEVRESDGNKVELTMWAADATGRRWFTGRYDARTDRNDYSKSRDRSLDPYQNVFNEFSNDLYDALQGFTDEEIADIRKTSRMRFFADMAPTVYGDYVEIGRKGNFEVVRLPADSDPMVARLERIRERDALFLDTLNEHYANFYYGIALPYADWREASREAELEYKRLRRSALLRGLAGVAMVAVATEMSRGDSSDSRAERRTRSTLKNYAIMGGIEMAASSFGRLAEARLQRQSIAELSESFGQEAAPMIVDVRGQTRRLTGTAAAQYDQWRELLREINERETGFPTPDIAINGRTSEQAADGG